MLLLFVPCIKLQAQVSIITTICGNDTAGYSGDNGLAVNAKVGNVQQHCLDKSGNLLIADGLNHRIRRIDISTGIISTIVGTGVGGFNGDGIAATSAQLFVPQGIGVDSEGNIYISDGLNYRIRKVTASTGVINTIAGNGVQGSFGNNVPATNARIDGPAGIFVDKEENIFFADFNNNIVRKINASTGIIRTVAGRKISGYTGDGGAATAAELNAPFDIAVDRDGNLIICEAYNHVLRKVNTDGIISTIAGNGILGFAGDNGPAYLARFQNPTGIFIDKENNIYISDYGNGSIRKIDGATGVITTVVGMGVMGYDGDGGPASNAKMEPSDVCIDSFGTMYIADYTNHRIRKVYNPYLAVPKSIVGNDYELYPNPANNELTIVSPSSLLTNANMTICDVVGKVVMERKLNSAKETIDISALNNGVYVVQVYDAEHTTRSMTKLVVAR